MKLQRSFKNAKVKAGSLVETVVAIVIITICLLLALTIYIRVLEQDSGASEMKAKYDVHRLLTETKSQQDFEPETFVYDSYKIRKVVADRSDAGLVQVTFRVETVADTISYKYYVTKKND